MICPYCGHEDTKVLESRMSAEKTSVRRRRMCENCRERFTTYERFEINPIIVIKKNKSKQDFSREKIIGSIKAACPKSGPEEGIIQEIAARVEFEISMNGKKEITSNYIGEKVLQYLKPVNEIAYLRYLSVFKEIESVSELYKEYKKSDERFVCVES